MEILCVLIGIFVGIASAGYMFIKPLAERDNTIAEQKEENLKVCSENGALRAKIDDISFELSTAYKENELKDKKIECIKTILEQNDYGRPEKKLEKLKELVDDYQSKN